MIKAFKAALLVAMLAVLYLRMQPSEASYEPIWWAFEFDCGGGATLFSPLDSTTYYFGTGAGAAPVTTTNGGHRAQIPVTGTVKRVYGNLVVNGTLGSNENITITVVNITAGTSQNITTTGQATAASQSFSNTAMTLAVTAGDEVVISMATPAWATNPTQVGVYLRMEIV